MPCLTIVNSVFSIINLVLLSYVDSNDIQGRAVEIINNSEVIIGCVFILEFIYHLKYDYANYTLFEKIFNWDRIVEFLNIFEILLI